MLPGDDVSDSTDWLETPLAVLAPVENAIRCQVCRDFYTTPMITSCSHTFCSLCIRRYLSQEGRCPACREPDQEIKLRRNWVVEELVAQFKAGRNTILHFARSVTIEEHQRPAKKRKVTATTATSSSEIQQRRSTRSQARRDTPTNGSFVSAPASGEIEDSEAGSEYEDNPRAQQKQSSTPNDGLVACPICNRRMKEAQINAHLDANCSNVPPIQATAAPNSTDSPQGLSAPQTTSTLPYGQAKPAAKERLPTLNYSMLTETALRKKLKELSIPGHGSKELMRRRHTEWMNLWNANCDAKDPVSTRQLLNDLDKWERTLGRQVDKGPSGVMLKEFDRDAWQKTNKDNFEDLIRKAREGRRAVTSSTTTNERPVEISQQVNSEDRNEVMTNATAINEDVVMEPSANVQVSVDGQQNDVHLGHQYVGPISQDSSITMLGPTNLSDTAQTDGYRGGYDVGAIPK